MLEDIVTQSLLVAGVTLSKKIVETYISPKINNLKNKSRSKEIEKHFEEYFKNSYLKRSYVKTIASPDNPRLLSDIYVPLKIWRVYMVHDEKGGEDVEEETYLINKYDENILAKHSNILIIDTAGMGKSTILNKMFLSVLAQGVGCPIFLNLRKLEKKSVIKAILDELSLIDKELDETALRKLISEGDFIFFFDGLDEIPYDSRNEVIDDLISFISKASNNKFIMSSRADSSTNSFHNFVEFKIQSLEFEEAIELIQKYDDSDSKTISKDLYYELRSNRSSHIEDFLRNPLLTSLLYVTYKQNRTLAERTAEFYRSVCDALLFRHDSFKEGKYKHEHKSKLSAGSIEKILRYIAFATFLKSKTSYNKIDLTQIIQEFKDKNTSFDFEINDFIDDLITNVPLLIQDGNYYTWCHKSMQEYFFAEYLLMDSGNRKKEYLLGIYNSSRLSYYSNVLELYYDLDQECFEEIIVLNLFNKITDLHKVLETKGRPSIENRELSTLIQYIPSLFKIDEQTSILIENAILGENVKVEHEILIDLFRKAMNKTSTDYLSNSSYSVNGLIIELNKIKYLVMLISQFPSWGWWGNSYSLDGKQILSILGFLSRKEGYKEHLLDYCRRTEEKYLPLNVVKIDNSYNLFTQLSRSDPPLLILTLEENLEEAIELMGIYCDSCEKRDGELEINYEFILNKQKRIKDGLNFKKREEFIF